MKKTAEVLFALLGYEIFGGEYRGDRSRLEDDSLVASVCSLAAFHDMAHLVADALGRLSIVPKSEKLANAVSREQLKAIYRSERADSELESLYAVFEDEKIEYMPLKGAVIRNLYPERWMRTSCDVDILVRRTDLERAEQAISKRLEYRYEERGDHDAAYISPSGLRLELHYALSDERISLDIFDSVWERAYAKKDGEWRRYMDDGLFYLYHLHHMAKHIGNGGCGIKPILDLCLIPQGDEALVAEYGLDRFDRTARGLARAWFFGEKSDELCDGLADYILGAGVYGSLNNAVAAGSAKKGGRMRYLLSRIFLPYDRMKYYYPEVEGHRWLMPAYQVKRWCRIMFCGGAKRSATEVKTIAAIDGGREKATAKLLRDLGLK